MKSVTRYQTRDGEIHLSQSKAETYAHDRAVMALHAAIKTASTDNPDNYLLANRLLEEHTEAVRAALKWWDNMQLEVED